MQYEGNRANALSEASMPGHDYAYHDDDDDVSRYQSGSSYTTDGTYATEDISDDDPATNRCCQRKGKKKACKVSERVGVQCSVDGILSLCQ